MTFSLTMDAADPATLAAFWARALGYELEPPPAGFSTWVEALTAWGVPEDQFGSASAITDPSGAGPRIFIQRVPEPKTAKNRLHLDVHSGAGRPGSKDMDVVRRRAAELVEAGATIVEEFDQAQIGQWIVMTDPEGNEFCVV